MKKKQFRGLADLTQLRFAATEAKLSGILQREKALRAQLAMLHEDRHASAQAERVATEPAFRAGADIRWHQWIEHRRAVLNQELAQTLAHRERQLKQVREAFGKNEAVKELVRRHRIATLREMQRRSDQTS